MEKGRFEMRRSEVIGTCLVNCDYFDDLETANSAVELLFAQTFPKENFQHWNKHISPGEAKLYIEQMQGKNEIDFKYLVTILSRSNLSST